MRVFFIILSLILFLSCQSDKVRESGDSGENNETTVSHQTDGSTDESTGEPSSMETEPSESDQSSGSLQTVDPAKEFDQPWTDLNRPIIIDPYSGNGIDWDKLQTDKRVAAIIHKATEGLIVDKKYHERRAKAKKLGYKWGSYHLGKSGDPLEQADFYLKTIENADDEVLALDLEDLNNPKFMTLSDAVKFIERIKEKTGRYPILYGNRIVCTEISNQYGKENVFSKCPLWYARFKGKVTDFNDKTWNTYTIWQFSCEINCTPEQFKAGECFYSVPGTQNDMDVNVYNGSMADLVKDWPNI